MSVVSKRLSNLKPDTLSPMLDRSSAAAGIGGWVGKNQMSGYTPAAKCYWGLMVVCGLTVLSWSLFMLATLPMGRLLWVLVGLLFVATAASFPAEVPRTKHVLPLADVFVFAMLAIMGCPSAVLAAGVESLIRALSRSRLRSAWLCESGASMVAMAVCSSSFGAMLGGLGVMGMAAASAQLVALCLAALVYATLNSALQNYAHGFKQGRWLTLRNWLQADSGIAPRILVSAFVAAMLALGARLFGLALMPIAAVMMITSALALRCIMAQRGPNSSEGEALLARTCPQAEQRQQHFMVAFHHAAIGMAMVDFSGRVLRVNKALCDLLGDTEEMIKSGAFEEVLHPSDAPLLRQKVESMMAINETVFTLELRCRTRQGKVFWAAAHCSRYQDSHDDSGSGIGDCLILQLHDISPRRLAESHLQHVALHDSLTDLANRHCFNQALSAAVEHSRPDSGPHFAVMFLDLDRFKIVNDSFGHQAGNALLCEVAARLKSCVTPNDLVARLGGDEFAVLLQDVQGKADGLTLAQRVLDVICQPVFVNETEIEPSASVGITFSDMGYRTMQEVLRDADMAMYEAKARGRSCVAVFDHHMQERVTDKLSLEADLHHAIGDGQLNLKFQPLYDLTSYRITGFEALVRWRHPRRGVITPVVLIALAEKSARIEALTDWVINCSLAQLAQWQKAYSGMGQLKMHVNVSGRDLDRSDFVRSVQAALQRHSIAPRSLTLEITEAAMLGRMAHALQAMHELRQCGVRFALDDFGTGSSSLTYLSSLPIDSLKIDRSIVMSMQDKPLNVELIRTIQLLGNSLGREVVAEGIETADQLATLRLLGINTGQGYLLSRPLQPQQAMDLLETHHHSFMSHEA